MSKVPLSDMTGWMLIGWEISPGARCVIHVQNIRKPIQRAAIALFNPKSLQFKNFGLASRGFQFITSVSVEERDGHQTLTLHFGDTFISAQCREVEAWATGSTHWS